MLEIILLERNELNGVLKNVKAPELELQDPSNPINLNSSA